MSLKHWEMHYRGGALLTCLTTPAGGYDQELESLWTDVLSDLPDGDGAAVLDAGRAERCGLHCNKSEPQPHGGDNLVGWRLSFRKPAG